MWRDPRRLAAAICVLAAIVVWNVSFDRSIRLGADRFFEHHAAWARGEAPRPTLRGVMEPTARTGARDATAWAVLVLAAGAGAVLLVARRSGASSSGR